MTEEKKRNIWFVLTIITSSVYLLWRIFFTIPWNGGVIQAAAGIILILAETVTTLGDGGTDGQPNEEQRL